MGSLAEKTHVNMRNQVIKIKAWLSSQLFREQFPSHYAEVLNSLPIQEYVNPIHGHLNLAGKLLQEKTKLEMGPCIHISYGSPEDLMQADFLTKLCYDSYDVVNSYFYSMLQKDNLYCSTLYKLAKIEINFTSDLLNEDYLE